MYKKHQIKINTTRRKRFHIFSLFALACVIICFVIIVSLAKTHDQLNKAAVYKRLLISKQDQKNGGDSIQASFTSPKEKPSLLYLDDTGYKIADQQPNNIRTDDNRNLILIDRRHKNASILREPKEGPYYSSIEHDPTIDENALPETYKFYLNKNYRTSQCTDTNPIKNVVFLRSHRTGSHTLSNIFYRYGEINGLFFALPNGLTFQYYWPLRFHHSHVAKDLLNTNAPNFVINVARNSKNNLKALTSKETFNVAIVRHPVPHFQSIYEYVDIPYFIDDMYMNKTTNYFSKFVEDPKGSVAAIMNHTQAFYPSFHLLKNAQLFDLGYEDRHYQTSLDLQFIINQLDEQLDLVLVNEYMEESLVLLQRQLCWQLSDMVHISQRMRRYHENISEKDKKAILEWNKEDLVLYNHFNETLFKRLQDQDDSFWADVQELKDLLKSVKEECAEDIKTGNGQFEGQNSTDVINKTELRQDNTTTSNYSSDNAALLLEDSFEIKYKLRKEIRPDMRRTCERLLMSEKEYVKLLKNIQKVRISENSKQVFTSKFIKNSTNGNFYYSVHQIDNSTAVEDNMLHSNEVLVKSNSDNVNDAEELKEIVFGHQEN